MIGSSCDIYKTCKTCGQTKWYKKFRSKGQGRRRAYCKRCQSRFYQYKFDTQFLKNTDIKVRFRLPTNRRVQYKVSYEQAILMVNEGMAGIVHETLIHKLYDKQSFNQMILKRDNYKCCYCGKHGDTIDHIKPTSKGGITSFNNCICACEKCNKQKDNLSLYEYLFYIEPLVISGNISDKRIGLQIHYLLQSLLSLTNRLDEEVFEEQTLQRIHKTIEQIENTVRILKADILDINK